MKKFFSSAFVFCFLALSCASAPAQGVYVTRGASGPVFSDKPQAGSREVQLKPLNVVPPPKESPPAVKSRDAGNSGPDRPGRNVHTYESFFIVSPENNASVAAGSASMEVRLAVDPPLRLGEGHAFVVSINGRFVGQQFAATEFMIPPGFWPEGIVPGDQAMQLEASIVDGAGQVLMRAPSVLFRARHQVFHQPLPGHMAPHRAQPPGRPAVLPGKPKPPAESERMSSAVMRKKPD